MDREALTPVRPEPARLRNQIIVALRGAIESGTLRPGERLIDRELCERLGVSRTSLREALRELEAIGVFSSDNRGLSVAVLTPDEANNIYAVRGVVEALVVGQFTQLATDEEVAALAGLAKVLKAAYSAGSVQEIIRSKRALYDQICHGARNTIALDIIDRLTLRTAALRSRSLSRPERQKQSISEIDAIIRAIRARDRSAAAAAAAEHVNHAATSALDKKVLDSLGAPDEPRSAVPRRAKAGRRA